MSDTCFVSVVVPVRNEEAFIARCLNAILNQDYPRECFEVIVADGLSDDHTIQIIQSLPGATSVRIIQNPQRIQSAGLNAAIHEARGDIIVRVDGHTIVAPDYLRQCVAALQETGAAVVGGPIHPVGITPMGRAIASAMKTRFAVPGAFHASTTGQYTDTVYLGAWPRCVLDQAGGFDEHFSINEDYELSYRIRHMGGKIYLSPALRSCYYGRQTLRALARQYFTYGRGKTSTLKKNPASLQVRQLAAPSFVGALLAGFPLSFFVPLVGWLWLFMLALYLTVNLAFSLSAARRSEYRLFWRIPLVFATIHLAWGSGFWMGLFFGDVKAAQQRAVPPHLSLLRDG